MKEQDEKPTEQPDADEAAEDVDAQTARIEAIQEELGEPTPDND